MDPNKVMKSDLDDIVFEHRNKAYGAYLLRKLYPGNLLKASSAAIILFALAISSPLIAKLIGGNTEEEKPVVVEVNLETPPPLDPNKPPPPPPPPPPKLEPPPPAASVKYVPPKVVEDKDVAEEEPPPVVEELKDVQIATKTQDGVKSGAPVIMDTDGQGDAPPVEVRKEPEVFNRVEQMPTFPDGEAAMLRWLSENIKYPAIARENGIEGTVVVQFIVDEHGNITSPNVIRSLAGGCDQEALRVVKKMPRWKPGRQQGREVRVKFTLPIKFKLQ